MAENPAAPAGTGGGRTGRVRRVLLWTLLAVALAVTVGGGWLYHQVNGKLSSVDLDHELGPDRPVAPPDAVPARAVLLLGSDSAAQDQPPASGGARSALPASGSALVVHLPDDGSGATAVTLPADTVVPAPPCAEGEGATAHDPDDAASAGADEVSLGAVHTLGGPGCVVRVAEELSGIRMDHYLEVDFAGFGPLVDALGGITVPAGEPAAPGENAEPATGSHRLTGDEAVAALRSAPPQDQQQYLLALVEEITAQDLLSRPATLYRVADAAADVLTTDSELGSLPDLLAFARELHDLGAADVRVLGMPEGDERAAAFWDDLRTGE